MRFLRSLFVLLPLLAIAACGPGTQEPPESVQETPAEAAVVPDEVVGTYRLTGINGEVLPGRISQVDECEVQIAEGSIELGADAAYDLDLLARAVCGDDDESGGADLMDRATSEGLFTVEGFEIRFNDAITRADPEAYDDRLSEETNETEAEDEMEEEYDDTPELYDATKFAGTGTIRDTLLTIRLDDDLTTMTFAKE